MTYLPNEVFSARGTGALPPTLVSKMNPSDTKPLDRQHSHQIGGRGALCVFKMFYQVHFIKDFMVNVNIFKTNGA